MLQLMGPKLGVKVKVDHVEGPKYVTWTLEFRVPPRQYVVTIYQWQFKSIVMVPRILIFWSNPHLFDGLDVNQVDLERLPTCCRVGRHVDFSFIQISLVTQALMV